MGAVAPELFCWHPFLMAIDPTKFGDAAAIMRLPVPVRPPDTRTIDEVREDVRRRAALLSSRALDELVRIAEESAESNPRLARDCWVAIMDRGGIVPPSAAALIGGGNANVNILVQINQRRARSETIEG